MGWGGDFFYIYLFVCVTFMNLLSFESQETSCQLGSIKAKHLDFYVFIIEDLI